ncbi:E3 ubiquitin-protein ligase bre1 [Basidiobolus ranarum]|uniref:E3 ubiquitin protein ligase n=1 Tax=Basidiobolus ranarum TaxID=34480 RepID=A0ABR2WNP6_9FUNG
MIDRKRRKSGDLDLEDVTSSPHKRQNNDLNENESSSKGRDDDPATQAEEHILNFQKEAIWRQMQKYKRKAQRAEENIARLKKKQDTYESRFLMIARFWDKLIDDLKLVTTRLGETEPEFKPEKNFLSFLLTESDESGELLEFVRNKADFSKEILNQVVTKLVIIEEKRESTNADLRKLAELNSSDSSELVSLLKRENKELKELYDQQNTSMSDLQHRYRTLSCKSVGLEQELQRAQLIIQDSNKQVDDTKAELKKIEKTIDRSNCSTTCDQVKTEIPDSREENNGIQENLLKQEDATDPAFEGQLVHFASLAENRLKELEEMKNERIKLRETVDQLHMQISGVSEELLLESPTFKHIQTQCNRYRGDALRLGEAVEKLNRELDDLRVTQRINLEKVEQEEIGRRNVLEAQIRKLQEELATAKKNRDHFKRELDLRNSKDNAELIQNQQIKIIANSRKDQITSLMLEVRRLKMRIAADAGDKEALEYLSKTPQNQDDSVEDSLRKDLKKAESTIQELTTQIKVYRQASEENVHLQDVMLSEEKLKERVDQLQQDVTEQQNKIRILESGNSGIVSLTEKVVATEERIKELLLKCEFHEKTESQLMSEIENVGKAWVQLEEQNSRKVLDLAQKEDRIVELLAEKTKSEQKCAILAKQKDNYTALSLSLKRQSEKQMEQIRKLEEKERASSQQFTNMERELASANSGLKACKDKLVDIMYQLDEAKEKLAKSEYKITDMQHILKERTHTFEHDLHHGKRLEEECTSLKKKVASLTSNQGESELAQMCDEYKALLKCNSCNIRFKSHVLMRCMHVFCRECIDSRIETRQRKCPNCGEGFGANDVKQIYL